MPCVPSPHTSHPSASDFSSQAENTTAVSSRLLTAPCFSLQDFPQDSCRQGTPLWDVRCGFWGETAGLGGARIAAGDRDGAPGLLQQ